MEIAIIALTVALILVVGAMGVLHYRQTSADLRERETDT
jgi:hypothetical protein